MNTQMKVGREDENKGAVLLVKRMVKPTIGAVNRHKTQSVLGVVDIASAIGTIPDAVKEVGVGAETIEVGLAVGIRRAIHVVGLGEHVSDACLLWFLCPC